MSIYHNQNLIIMNKTIFISVFITLIIISGKLTAQCTDPEPYIIPEQETVCGVYHEISVQNVQGSGVWTAYVNGEPMDPAPPILPSPTDPDITVTISEYPGNSIEIEFVWTETIEEGGDICTGTASQTVIFAKTPGSSVVIPIVDEVCGNIHTLYADTTGFGWANGHWIMPDIDVVFNNQYIPDATVEIVSPESFGDSAYVAIPFVWEMENLGCKSHDTLFTYFYQIPTAFAGIDDAVCGNDYITGAEFSIPESEGYNPHGTWSVYSRPNPAASANIMPANAPVSNIAVSHYGIWEFLFRENNSNATFCYDIDTVMIEFVEQPIAYAGEDQHVCGPCVQMNADGLGIWLPVGQSFPNGDYDNPNAIVCVNAYGSYEFVWKVTNTATSMDFDCIDTDTVTITFWREPEAVILTDEEDSTTCGLTFNNLRAQMQGSGITGYWWNATDPDVVYGNPNSHNTHVTVTTYGYHDFYWIVNNGPIFQPDFCVDSAGPLRIHFIEIPTANAGGDALLCGYTGQMNAIPSVGTGVWSTSTPLVSFEHQNNPNTQINSQVLNTGNAVYPYFDIIWTEDNTNGCTDKDTIKVIFARIPSSVFHIVPPKCFGETATLSAKEDSLPHYQWDFYSGIVDSISYENSQGGLFEYFVYWNNGDIAHQVSLITTNYWGCQSEITYDTVYEPLTPDFGVNIIKDTCLLSQGAIIFEDTIGTNAFYWLNPEVGPEPNTQITTVYDLPEGYYDIRARYRTPNQGWYNYYMQIFGNAMCTDTITYYIPNYAYFDVTCPDDIYIYDNQIIYMQGAEPTGGIFYLDGNEISHFNPQEHSNGIYTIMYHIFDEDSDCASVCYFNIVVDNETIIQSICKLEFSVYPNPATEILIVENVPNKSQIRIYDVTGKIIISMIGDTYNEIDISGFESGMYIISVIDNNTGFGTKNIIKY